MVFAVIKTGGKQYRVTPGDVVLVERLEGQEGQSVHLTDVLMVSQEDKMIVGAPLVSGTHVEATIKAQTRGDKIIVFKKKRRQGYRRKKGHRQDLTLLTINAICEAGKATKAAAPKKSVASEVLLPGESEGSTPSPTANETKPKAVRSKKISKVVEEE